MTDLFNGRSLFAKRRKVTADHKHNSPSSLPTSDPSPPDDTVSLADTFSDSSSRPTTAIRSEDQSEPSSLSPPKRHHRRDSSLTSFTELKSSFRRRSTSLRSKGRDPSSIWDKLAPTGQHEDRRQASNARPHLNISTLTSQASADNVGRNGSYSGRTPASALDSHSSSSSIKINHLNNGWNPGVRRDDPHRPPTALGAPYNATRSASSTHLPNSNDPRSLSRKVTDTSNRRISLLKYLRQIYASQTHWFNTYRFSSSQIAGFPSHAPPRLARRTQSLLILGLSLPFALDPHHNSLPDYLKTLSALLAEYENYVTLHPSDGTTYTKSRIPNMFKRGVSGTSKARRDSSADGLLTSPQTEDSRSAGLSTSGPSPASATWASFPNMVQEADLMQGEEYQFLLTPGLPFDCDYSETFNTLCDVLCDVYRHLGQAVAAKAEQEAGSEEGAPSLGVVVESFTKVDSRVKKLVLGGLVREFEEASRQGVKSEVAGVGRLVLGGIV